MSEVEGNEEPTPTAPPKKKATRKKALRSSKPAPKPPVEDDPAASLLASLRAHRESERQEAVRVEQEQEDRAVYVVDCPTAGCKGPAWACYGHPFAGPLTPAGLPMPQRFVHSGLDDESDYYVRHQGLCAACLAREGVRRSVVPVDRLIQVHEVAG